MESIKETLWQVYLSVSNHLLNSVPTTISLSIFNMKLTLVALTALLPCTTLGAALVAAPTLPSITNTGTPERDVEIESADLDKRSIKVVTGKVLVDGLHYRPCPLVVSYCAPNGQFAKGTKISMVCFTRTATTTVNGDK